MGQMQVVRNYQQSILLTPGGGVGILSADGSAFASWSSGTSFTITGFSTTKANDVIVVASDINSADITSVVSTAAGAFTFRAVSPGVLHGNKIWEYYLISSGVLTNDTITITLDRAPSFAEAIALAINGANLSTPYDPNGALPYTAVSGLGLISTTQSATMLLNMLRGQDTASAPDTGWTDAVSRPSGRFVCMTYKIVSAAQTSLSVNDTMSGVNGIISDAIQASGQ